MIVQKIFFIAVNYNGFRYTKEYIESILHLKNPNKIETKIIIIDNGSNSDEYNRLENYCEKISTLILIKNSINRGYFGGLNSGINRLSPDGNTLVVIGNNDLTFENNFLSSLEEVSFDKEIMVLAPNVITKDGKHQNPHIIKKCSTLSKIKAQVYNSNYYIGRFLQFINSYIKKIFLPNPSGKKFYNKRMIIRAGVGACYILTNNFFNHFKKLDESVFMWGEEVILANQIESVNGKTLYENTLIVYHHESASVKKIKNKERYQIGKKSYGIYKKYL